MLLGGGLEKALFALPHISIVSSVYSSLQILCGCLWSVCLASRKGCGVFQQSRFKV
jgi:hypothetical protein